MKVELEKLIARERKFKRELAELRALLQKTRQQVSPDVKVVKMIEEAIQEIQKSV